MSTGVHVSVPGVLTAAAGLQVDRKQSGKYVLLHFTAPPRLLQQRAMQPPQLAPPPDASFLGTMATALSAGGSLALKLF